MLGFVPIPKVGTGLPLVLYGLAVASTGDRWRLGHRPALDGLRAVAVVLVLCVHLGAPLCASAGAVGVGAFFTLSGFLISSILLSEYASTGRIALPRFFGRRARRLMPALLVLVVLDVVIGVAIRGRITDWPTILGTLTYTANFVKVFAPEVDTAMGQTWSLSVEEQFYLLWPLALLVLLRLPKPRVLTILCAASLASLGLRLALWDGSLPTAVRIYNGLDTRADQLLMGCALGVFMSGRRERRPLPGFAACGLVVILLATQLTWAATMVTGPLLVAVATCCVIYAAVNGGAKFLTWRPLAYLGNRSYGVYLFHSPAMILGGIWVGDSWTTKLLVWVPLALVMAEVSWRLVEAPALRLGRSVRAVEPSQRQPDQPLVLSGQCIHLGGDLRVRR